MTWSLGGRPRLPRLPFVGNLGLPIAEKEIRALLRLRRYFWLQFIYLAVIAVGMGLIAHAESAGGAPPEVVGRVLFETFFVVQTVLIYVIFPALAATSISGERVEKSFDLLLISDLRPAEIIWGKFLGVLGCCCFFLLVSVPLLATCLLFGGVAFAHVVEHYALLLVQCAAIAIFGVWISSAARGNVWAVIVAYCVSLGVGALVVSALGAFFQFRNRDLSVLEFVRSGAGIAAQWPWLSTAAAAFVLFFSLCLVLALRPLCGPEANRSTPLRLWVLALGLVSMALVHEFDGLLSAVAGAATTRDVEDWYQGLTTISVLVLFVLGTILAGERLEVPRSVAASVRRRPWLGPLGWWLLPGGLRGVAFAALLLVLTWIGLETLLAGSGSGAPMGSGLAPVPADLLSATWRLLFVALAAYFALAFLLATCGVLGSTNWWIVTGVAVSLNVHPLVWFTTPGASGGFRSNPMTVIGNVAHLWTRPRTLPEGWDSCVLGHAIGALALFVAALVVMRWRRRPMFGYASPVGHA
ncbi:MAG: ABC transporter permease [Planctomycetota bacterium]